MQTVVAKSNTLQQVDLETFISPWMKLAQFRNDDKEAGKYVVA